MSFNTQNLGVEPARKSYYHVADWSVPSVLALTTDRQGGVSEDPYSSFNLADHVGDRSASVQANRDLLVRDFPELGTINWLNQVHGATVVSVSQALAASPHKLAADAIYTDLVDSPCAVLTADCLPILLASKDGSEVAAIHGGWRSLAQGIISETLLHFRTARKDVLAWLGPAIGASAFEVGCDVLKAMMEVSTEAMSAFTLGKTANKYWCDIYQLAKIFLAQQQVEQVSGGQFCTVRDSESFFSYRREGQTGRMASLIWIRS